MLILAIWIVFAVLAPGSASAHAQLESTQPAQGAILKKSPAAVEFRFGEAVEVAFGAVRVFNSHGARVDVGPPTRPDGDSSIGVRLKPDLPDGAYTATYRVISADSHPVSGGFSFQVGAGAGAPRSVASLLSGEKAGPALQAFYGAVRFAGYAALCLVLGALAFWMFAFAPSAPGSDAAQQAFMARVARLVSVGAIAGLCAALLALVCQAAVAGGTGLWHAVGWSPLKAVAETRSGTWMTVRLGVWIVICAAWFGARATAGDRSAGRLVFALAVIAAAMPAMIGHPAVTSPTLLMVPADFFHVLAMAVWVGGLAAAYFALPAATAELDDRRRIALLVDVFSRFSQIALGCVVLLVATGVIQSIVHLEAFSDLWSSAFGRAISVKVILLVALIGLGALNRFRVIPGLRRRMAAGESPGSTGVALKRSLAAELILTALVIAAASALVVYAPSATAARGPFAESATMGPLAAQLIVDPARQGVNQIHLYLTSAKTGVQFDGSKQLEVQLTQPKAGIGPIDATMTKAGPGHYTDGAAVIPVPGDWTIAVISRVSEFDQYEHDFAVKIR